MLLAGLLLEAVQPGTLGMAGGTFFTCIGVVFTLVMYKKKQGVNG